MSTQTSLFPVAHARRCDPQTSKEAAKSVQRIPSYRADILTVIRRFGPISDERLITLYRDLEYPHQSDSGIRTRRSELVALGLVVDSGLMGYTLSNRRTILWKVKGEK